LEEEDVLSAAVWMSVDVTVLLQSTTVPKTSKVNALGGELRISLWDNGVVILFRK